MVEKRLILDRIETIHQCLDLARKLGTNPRAKFSATPELFMLAERCLHLAMEALLDIANHVVSDQNLGSPESYADAIEKLGAAKVIPRSLVKKLIPWVGFRNLLVHGYLKLDHGITHDAIRKDLPVLRHFVRKISELL